MLACQIQNGGNSPGKMGSPQIKILEGVCVCKEHVYGIKWRKQAKKKGSVTAIM
jgi:hypothetical protein